MAELSLKSLRKHFGKLEIIRGIDLDIDDGEFVVFVGPSGCGKSTLLRLIAGLEHISAGELRIGKRLVNEVQASKRGVAMVFQSYALYPHLTVGDNMGFGLKVRRVPADKRRKLVADAAAMLQLEPLLDRFPRQLSGGQRQRVAIGRAIVGHPEVFLFDEPLSNLDAELRVHMRSEIAALHQRMATTMIYVTHDQVEAMTLADKIVVLRDGQIEQVGTPRQLYQQPANIFVAQFIGSPKMNILPVKLAVELAPLVDPPGHAVSLGIRPEHIDIQTEPSQGLAGQLKLSEYTGSQNLIHAGIDGGQTCLITRDDDELPATGSKISLCAQVKDMHFFDEAGNALLR